MRQLLAQRQRGFLALAEGLARPFSERAARHDEDNTLPRENFDDLREAGLLRLSVPAELGGMGATLPEILPVLERLTAADGSTALAATMHISPLGQWGTVWRRTGDPRLERFLREAAEGRLVWASVTSEIGTPNLLTDARTRAERAEGGALRRGAGFTRAAPFERMWRDAQAGRIMPFDERAAADLTRRRAAS
ncbi:acyl-CoA dehydrogenase family protein [Actinomadura macra]|uniref:acyl-CoA dehydrogenase family protein n=1 Tax=Actinomadura macra TaxID=46164 RepID=UPI00082B216C|nr:acyl-CoA dehydrogenase family protein [Actinomadura macra]